MKTAFLAGEKTVLRGVARDDLAHYASLILTVYPNPHVVALSISWHSVGNNTVIQYKFFGGCCIAFLEHCQLIASHRVERQPVKECRTEFHHPNRHWQDDLGLTFNG